MTRGFVDLTLTFYKTKLCDYDYVTMKSLDTENKFFNPIWMWGQNKQD